MTAAIAGTAQVALSSTDLIVGGLRCAACISKLESGLRTVNGVARARVNFTTKKLHVDHDPMLDDEALIEAVERLGFRAHAAVVEDVTAPNESRRLAKALAVAGFAAMNVMLLSVSVWSGADGATRSLFHWLSAIIALPAVAYAGMPFFESAWGAVRRGRTNMDVPIAIGVMLTCAMSLFETMVSGPHAYFDGAVMLLAFLLAGRLLDTIMRERAADGVSALLRRLPTDVGVIGPGGVVRRVAIAMIEPGMRVLVAAGERVGVDGLVEGGASDIDRALITGESAPEAVETGDRVLAGTLNVTAPLTVRATASAGRTVISDIARMMGSAGLAKSRYIRIADRASRLYAPAVHGLAAMSLLGWLLAGAGWHAALLIAVSVLIITCPCALGLAVPVAQVVAARALLSRGILVCDGSALERLADVTTVLLDKTGTMTLGQLSPVSGMPSLAEERAALLALAQGSRHPLARSIAAALVEEGATAAVVDGLHEEPGQGMVGYIGEKRGALGRASLVDFEQQHSISQGPHCWFRLGDNAPHRIAFSDQAREDAGQAIAALRDQGLSPQLVSGDGWGAVAKLARQLGIFARASMTPFEKFELVSSLEQRGQRVLMVGDGLNDGPALKRASVSMAPSTASDAGRQSADLIYFGDRLMPLPISVQVARRTMKVVRQNFVLAIGYNVLAVPLAIAGKVTPLIAALAMSGSSLLVIANALRLQRAAR